MPNATPKSVDLKMRRQEVSQALAAIDIQDDAQPPGLCRPMVVQLKQVLSSLGSGFALFGRYLASRVDLLPASECAVLLEVDDCVEGISFEQICSQFQTEIGRSVQEAYAVFTPEPFESRLLYQTHSVCLHSGQNAIVKILNPNVKGVLEIDLNLLNLLESVCGQLGLTKSVFLSVQREFETAINEQIDFVREANALQLFNDELQGEYYQGVKVWPACCSYSFLTTLQAHDQTLAHILDQSGETDARALSIEQRRDLAMKWCGGWLRQVFEGRLFPVAPYIAHLSVSPSLPISIGRGQFSRLDPESRENLWAYITAVAMHDPDKACECLLMDMAVVNTTGDILKHLFRQVVPFRDGGWDHLGHLDTLPEHIFLQWQIASQSDCQPNATLVDFFRSFFLTAYVAHRLVPDQDMFGLALEAYRTQRDKERFQAAFDTGQWSDAMDKYATTLSALPEKVDALLSRAAGGDLKLKFRLREANEHREARNTSALGFALGLILVTLVLLTNHLSQFIEDGGWIEPVGAVIFVLVGLVLLRILTRTKV